MHDARVGFLSVGDVPLVLDLTEAFDGSEGSGGVEAAYRAATDLARQQVDPEADIHASADYRRHLAGVLTARVLAQAYDAAAGRSREGAA